MTAVTAQEVRAARGYLRSAGITKVSPRHFASAKKEIGKGYRQTLKYLNLLLSGGSGQGPSPIATADDDRLDPIEALGDSTPSQKLGYRNVAGSK